MKKYLKDNGLVERLTKSISITQPEVEFFKEEKTHLSLTMKNKDGEDIRVAVGIDIPWFKFAHNVVITTKNKPLMVEANKKLKKELYNVISGLRNNQLRDKENKVRNSIKF